jgi:hypothetical protein
MTELIDPGRTGLLFTPGDPASLIESVAKLSNDGDVLARMRVAVRHEFEQKFTPEANYQILMAAYARVLGAAFPNATAISQDAAFSGMPAGETLSNGLLAASR